ncbi:DUF6531 domain-containing protein [Microbulbifer thermotolerans]|uniref:DUF6531 domain-containing protein n=1 Tax=Microbulbifer thermotolerans TaxID=252514 RepID=UPI00224AF491|nr:DUF6531 domain-containing protein [Microbulbifer thermotolerans]MCX2836385.1 DUF6531 domain-containing protein [Microbulbifer thermotolerans]
MKKSGIEKLLSLVVIGLSAQGVALSTKADCILEFTSPEDGAVVYSPNITVYGRGGADVEHGDQGSVTATLNGSVFFSYSGSFTAAVSFLQSRGVAVTLQPGENFLSVTGSAGSCSAADSMTITYEEPEPDDPSDPSEPPECQPPTIWNESSGLCEKVCPADKPWDDTARDCVAPPERQGCDNLAGNPINFLSGHKLQRETIFEANGDFPLTFSWLYNSFGNHQKTGAGYSVGAGVSGETAVHTEQPLADDEQPISLPLDKDPTQEYTGSSSEHWRHNHSYFLAYYTLPDGDTERLIAYRPDGSDLHFADEGGIFVALANRDWRVSKEFDENQVHMGWTLEVAGRIEKYDTAGRILRVENEQGQGITYTYDEEGVHQESIADDNGNSITLDYTDGNLSQIARNDGTVYGFAYNANGLLQSITFPGSDNPQRVFLYEDSRFPNALTGVTDESGNVFSTFVYDEQGRAIRTEHNGGADSVEVDYVDANTRRLTNALGKQTTYHYTEVNGVKLITEIEGEASANCAAANKAYTYDDNGFIASETDWEGNLTTYTRDNLGRELSRTEAAGTPEARTILTEWHSEFNLPVKITTPESITEYSYDSSGRLMGQKVTPVASP